MNMILLLLFVALIFCQNTDFMIVGLSTNTSILYTDGNVCNFNSCQQIICELLSNSMAAYIGLFPLKNITVCPKLLPMSKVNMINFVLDEKTKMLSPSVCYTFEDCMMRACASFLSSKESFLMAFTGQCL